MGILEVQDLPATRNGVIRFNHTATEDSIALFCRLSDPNFLHSAYDSSSTQWTRFNTLLREKGREELCSPVVPAMYIASLIEGALDDPLVDGELAEIELVLNGFIVAGERLEGSLRFEDVQEQSDTAENPEDLTAYRFGRDSPISVNGETKVKIRSLRLSDKLDSIALPDGAVNISSQKPIVLTRDHARNYLDAILGDDHCDPAGCDLPRTFYAANTVSGMLLKYFLDLHPDKQAFYGKLGLEFFSPIREVYFGERLTGFVVRGRRPNKIELYVAGSDRRPILKADVLAEIVC